MTGRDPALASLAKANKLASKGKYQEADRLYEEIYMRFPDHPGLLLNQAMGHMIGGDGSGGVAYVERSLGACANYLPTMAFMSNLADMAESDEE